MTLQQLSMCMTHVGLPENFSDPYAYCTAAIPGGAYEVLSNHFNLGHVSNAVVLWLGMDPPDVFVYIFLPPLLLDSAVRMDFFLLKKVMTVGIQVAPLVTTGHMTDALVHPCWSANRSSGTSSLWPLPWCWPAHCCSSPSCSMPW